MKDESLSRALYDECKAELEKHQAIVEKCAAYSRDHFLSNCKDILEHRYRILLLMERLVTGAPLEGTTKTAWEHVNKDDP